MREKEEGFGAGWHFDSTPNSGQIKPSACFGCSRMMGFAAYFTNPKCILIKSATAMKGIDTAVPLCVCVLY